MTFRVERPYKYSLNQQYLGYAPQLDQYPIDIIEADDYAVTNGILELYKDKRTVATYSVGNWVSVIKEKDNK